MNAAVIVRRVGSPDNERGTSLPSRAQGGRKPGKGRIRRRRTLTNYDGGAHGIKPDVEHGRDRFLPPSFSNFATRQGERIRPMGKPPVDVIREQRPKEKKVLPSWSRSRWDD